MSLVNFKNLNFLTITFPFTAMISILHRLSGLILFLFIPFLLWILDTALSSSAGFNDIQLLFSKSIFKISLWFILSAFWYHLFAGIRHLIMDTGFGESLTAGRISGIIVIMLTILCAILTGIWLW